MANATRDSGAYIELELTKVENTIVLRQKTSSDAFAIKRHSGGHVHPGLVIVSLPSQMEGSGGGSLPPGKTFVTTRPFLRIVSFRHPEGTSCRSNFSYPRSGPPVVISTNVEKSLFVRKPFVRIPIENAVHCLERAISRLRSK
jgi:hypothetical protein